MALKTVFLRSFSALLAAFFALTALAFADAAPFDLAGPKVDVRVERAGKTLPILQCPTCKLAIASGSIPIYPRPSLPTTC